MIEASTAVSILIWAFVVASGGLIGCLVWFAQRIVNQLDRLQNLVTIEIHQLNLRVSTLEGWKNDIQHNRNNARQEVNQII